MEVQILEISELKWRSKRVSILTLTVSQLGDSRSYSERHPRGLAPAESLTVTERELKA